MTFANQSYERVRAPIDKQVERDEAVPADTKENGTIHTGRAAVNYANGSENSVESFFVCR